MKTDIKQTAFNKTDLKIDISEYRLPTDKRTVEYKRMLSKIKGCIEAKNSEYGYLSNLRINDVNLFFKNINLN